MSVLCRVDSPGSGEVSGLLQAVLHIRLLYHRRGATSLEGFIFRLTTSPRCDISNAVSYGVFFFLFHGNKGYIRWIRGSQLDYNKKSKCLNVSMMCRLLGDWDKEETIPSKNCWCEIQLLQSTDHHRLCPSEDAALQLGNSFEVCLDWLGQNLLY